MKLATLVRQSEFRRPLRHGVAAAVEHARVPFPHDYRMVVDVGAGRGQFGLFALKRFPKARIYSYEPLPSSFIIASSVFRGAERVSLRQVAIGASEGSVEMFVTADSDSSSLRRPTSEQAERFPGTEDVDRIQIDVIPLDTELPVIDRPALLKLDLQGGELDALRGAAQSLASIDDVLVECSFVELYDGQALADEIIRYLGDKGFTLRGFFDPTYGDDGTCIQADLLFVNTVGEDNPGIDLAVQ